MLNARVELKDGNIYEKCNVRSSNRKPLENLVLTIGECTCYKNTCNCIKEVTLKRNDVKQITLNE